MTALAPLFSLAANWYVAMNGDDAAEGTSWEKPLATVQKAVEKAANAESITVDDGVYVLDSPIVVPNTKVLKIVSRNGNADKVVFDGNNATYCLAFLKSGNNLLSGVTVRNGKGATYVPGSATYFPGGVYMAGGSLSNVTISNCHTRVDAGTSTISCLGGGVYQGSGTATGVKIYDCSIEVETTATKIPTCQGGGIYTLGLVSSGEISTCSVVVRAPNCAEDTGYKVGGGGIMSVGSGANRNCKVVGCSAVLESTSRTGGTGGGVFLYGNGDSLGDSLVADCVASRCGGGVAIRQKSTLQSCSISNNAIAARVEAGGGMIGGGGVVLDDHYTGAKIIDGCLIEGNVVSNLSASTSFRDCGGGGILVKGGTTDNPTIIRNSVIRDNAAWSYGGGVYFYDGGRGESATVVSNCWFSQNCAANRGGFAFATLASGGLVTDCRIDGHHAGDCLGKTGAGDGHVLVRHADGTAVNNNFTVRNCFITGNNPHGRANSLIWFYKGKAGNSPLTFEQCTISGNNAGSEVGNIIAFSGELDSVATNFTFRGGVVAGNQSFGLMNGTTMEGQTNVFSFSYTDTTSGLVQTGNETRGNLWPALVADPKFVDSANGDWRLARGSALRDKGGAVRAWMGDGSRRRGPMDMGDGTFTATLPDGANYGVKLVRNGARPRLCSSSPDMGCFECFVPNGLMVIFR